MRIGLFGGTFNPVHNGHIALAEAALSAFSLDRILFMPGFITPFKQGQTLASPEDRLAMLRLATADNPRFEVSTLELGRGGVSYTVHTLEALRAARPDDDLWLLVGLDSLLSLGRWYRAHDILKLATVGTLLRPGTTLPEGDLPGFSSGETALLRTHIANGDCPDIASSAIRAALNEGQDVSTLLPCPVASYISSHKLYRNDAP